jgi:hypothetical protein
MSLRKWLANNGFSQYYGLFEHHGIAFEQLPTLSENDLQFVGVQKLGDIKRIMRAIKHDYAADSVTLSTPLMIQKAAWGFVLLFRFAVRC